MSKFCLNPACIHPQNPDENEFCHGCSANLAESTQSYLFENYRVTKLLGEGGFGRTYLAEYLRRYNEPRLIKTLITSDQKQTQEKIKELFTREAEQLYQLDHPQIPKLYEYFEKDNNLYLVQEFIDGINLREELKQNQPFSEGKIQTILEDLLPVLAYIEEQNLLHRDIKPENIMRRHSDGMLMLIDFGAARVKTGIGLTMLTAIYTPGYAAIEHMMGRPVKASDIYSLGVTCIRLLTGCFPNTTTDPIYDDHENCLCWKDYLQENNIQVSDRLLAILDKMVASSLKDRYPDARAVLKDLMLPIFPPSSLPRIAETKEDITVSSSLYLPPQVSSAIVENEENLTTSSSLYLPSQVSSTIAKNEENLTTSTSLSLPSQTSGNSGKRFSFLAGVIAIFTGFIAIGGYFLLINRPSTIERNTQESVDKNEIIPLVDTLEVQYQKGNYQDCYQLAQGEPDRYNILVQEWIGKCGLAAAKIQANANSYSEAIAIAQTIPKTVPNYPEVEDNINIWSVKILEYATQVYRAGKLEEAIKVTDIIPDNSSAKTKVPHLISQWKQEQAKAELEAQAQEETSQQRSLISRTTGIDYSRLGNLLEAGKWQEADQKTTTMMLEAARRDTQGWFRRQDITQFPCEDLRIIDQLWLESSQGKSGFSVQKKVWQNNGSPANARGKGSVSTGNLGNLPSDLWEGNWGMWDVTLVELFNRTTKCNF